MNSTLALRDRKKVRQRKALADASLRLFLLQGYGATTLEQICAECEVTVPTLLRYFPTKEDLLFARQVDFLETCADALKNAVTEDEVIYTWLLFLRTSARRVASNPEVVNVYKIIVDTPTLLAKFHTIIRQYKALLEKALREQSGQKPGDDLHLWLLAHLLTVGPIEAALHALEAGDAASMAHRSDAVAKYILENFKRPADKPAKRSKPGNERNRRPSAD